MIQTELLNKKSICHALIASTNSPEVLIPTKCVIEDIHFNDSIPYYDLRVIKFYDNIDFLKKNMIEKSFLLKYRGKSKPFPIPKKIKTVGELETWFADEAPYRFCVESTFVVKTKNEMVELFNKIQEYLIIQNLRSIRTTAMRGLYEGSFKIQSKVEFSERLRRMIGDKFDENGFKELSESI
jgi:hypothetical protein